MILPMGKSGFIYVPQPYVTHNNSAQAFQRKTEQTVESKPPLELSQQEAWGLAIGIALVFVVSGIVLWRMFDL